MPVSAKTDTLSDHRTSFLAKLREETVMNNININEAKHSDDLDDSRRRVGSPTRGNAERDGSVAPSLPGESWALLSHPGATQSLRARGGTRLTPSPGARLGGRWVWGGSGAGDGGGRGCGGSGTSGWIPGSAVKWAGSRASREDTYYSCSEAPLETQMWAPQPEAERGTGKLQRSPF
ncbi:hypothetical protein H8957_015213 [Semnopithecus entellus]